MKKNHYILGMFLLGILLLTISFNNAVAVESDGSGEGEPIEPEEPAPEEPVIPDDDKDGVDDNFEDENKRDIEIWIGENVVEMASIRRHGDQKDIIDMRIGFNLEGLSVRVSFGTIIK
ncbi:MAG: hypothetical protein ACFFDN_40935, partial [Candidatus Hodarchaeota archaeon]